MLLTTDGNKRAGLNSTPTTSATTPPATSPTPTATPTTTPPALGTNNKDKSKCFLSPVHSTPFFTRQKKHFVHKFRTSLDFSSKA